MVTATVTAARSPTSRDHLPPHFPILSFHFTSSPSSPPPLTTLSCRGLGEECPKATEYCFLEKAQPSTYDRKMVELCEVLLGLHQV